MFIAGLGVGFVLGARAGRERYEQMAKLARKAADNPAVQQAAGAMQAQAAGLVKTTKGKLADQVPKLAETARSKAGTARSKAGTARSKVGTTLHDHGVGTRNSHGRPASDGGRGHYTSAPDTPGALTLLPRLPGRPARHRAGLPGFGPAGPGTEGCHKIIA